MINVKIDNKEIQLLLAMSGNDTWNTFNELKKIINFKNKLFDFLETLPGTFYKHK